GQRVLRINSGNIPADIRQELETAAKKDGKFRVSQGRGAYTFICYKVKDNNAFTYLNDKSISQADFIDSSKRFLRDLAVFSKMGIMNTSLIELFHSLEHQRRYLWMIDVLSPVQGIIFDRLGAGVVRGFSKTTEYPNPRIRFMADLAEFRTIERIIRFKEIGDRVIEKNKKNILASYLGDYFFSWVFIYASRLKKQGKLTRESFDDKNFINDIANNIKQVFLYFLGQFIDDKATIEEISRMINWKRLATQIVFYMGGAYKDYIAEGKIPQRVHGKYTKVMLKNQTSNYFDGWGYFDISLLDKEFPRLIKNHIIKTYLMRITNKTEISTVYKIAQDNDLADQIAADEMIPESYKPRLISLLGEYQHGFRYDGINEDLGPFNGPNPLTELIKALYVFSGFIVNEQGEQIQKLNNLKADKLNSNPRNSILPKAAASLGNIDISLMLIGQAI
ncbi:MAG: hypothetical protein KKD05_08575, partial [Candidatus Omnitrophica bacterium]|nr:hypothetical protein [Candidatus Omnitrophota bacterium]